VGERHTRDRSESASRPGEQQRQDDSSPEREEQDRGAGEDAVLPRFVERARERDGRAEDGADGGWAGAVEECLGVVVAAEAVEVGGAEEDEGEGGGEGDERREKAAADARAWGARTRSSCGGEFVFVDQATE
jgi:hypothetical protein